MDMCGRYYLDAENNAVQTLIAEIAARSDGARLLDMNLGEIFPTNTVPALTAGGPRLMRWGFSRYNGGGAVINARSETAMVKPMFAKSMQERRCLLPASRYFAHTGRGKKAKVCHCAAWWEAILPCRSLQARKTVSCSRIRNFDQGSCAGAGLSA